MRGQAQRSEKPLIYNVLYFGHAVLELQRREGRVVTGKRAAHRFAGPGDRNIRARKICGRELWLPERGPADDATPEDMTNKTRDRMRGQGLTADVGRRMLDSRSPGAVPSPAISMFNTAGLRPKNDRSDQRRRRRFVKALEVL